MITFAKMIAYMETLPRTQMIVRISPQLFSQLKHNAKRKNLSLNAYVEQELALIAKPKLPKLPKDFQADPVLASFSGLMRTPSQDELDQDPKLAYLWEKYYK